MLVTGESTCSSVTLSTSFSQARTNQGTRNISEYSLRQVEDSLCVHFFRKMAAVLQCFIKEYQWLVTKYLKYSGLTATYKHLLNNPGSLLSLQMA